MYKVGQALYIPPMRLSLNPADRKFWPKTVEPGFSVKRNNWIIEDAMKKHDLNVKRKKAEFADKLGERTHAMASYLKGGQGVDRSRTIEKYLGKIEHAHLRGEDIRNKLVSQQKMLLTNKKEIYEQEQARKLITKSIVEGKTFKIKRTNAKKKQKSSKKA